MEAAQRRGDAGGPETAPHFVEEPQPGDAPAWEEIEAGRYMPRRIKGSYKGRALG